MIEGADQKDKQGTKTAPSGCLMDLRMMMMVDDDEVVEMVLAGSRVEVMRRGINHPMLMQPNRQSTRSRHDQKAGCDGPLDAEAEKKSVSRNQEDELVKLQPAQQAARLLAEKQEKTRRSKGQRTLPAE